MSFNAKNLSYDKNEPAFLRRLRGQYGDGSGFRNDRPNPRPTKKRDADDDDAPTYVDEESNEVISKEEYEALVKGDSEDKVAEDAGNNNEDGSNETKALDTTTSAGEESKAATETPGPKAKQQVAEIGGAKKRKQGKVIGDDATEPDAKKPQTSRKPKLKKKIKLSFDDEE
ncbi:hypothetical protein FQN53_000994 [Emmonsiellopsis sp. PD_33]|nr:hypothetical protein FQN53_000994 [Emmonsiellopsis sp. PD_33]